MVLKERIKIWFWEITKKTPEQVRRYRRAGYWKVHNFNYHPLKNGVFLMPLTSINSPEKIAHQTFIKCGTGHFLVKGWCPCKKSCRKVKNITLCDLILEPVGDSYRTTLFKIKGLSHYYWFKKSDAQIREILERGSVRKK